MTHSPVASDLTLRRRAEIVIESNEACSEPGELAATQELAETNRLIHELQVCQIELEMQNNELSRNQQELEASYTRYFELFDMAPVGYLTIDNQGNIQKANLTVATLLGVARGDLLNTPLSCYILPEDRDVFHMQRRQLAESVMPQQWEMRMVRTGGSLFWGELKATPTWNDECLVVIADIDRRKQAEMTLHHHSMEELSKHAEQYRAMIVTNLFGFWIADTAGKLLDVNDTYCRMSGYAREELLQRSIPDLEAVESAEDTVRHIQLLIEAGVAQFESRHRARDGRIFDVEVSTSYLCSQGKIIAFFRDISERKMREKLDLISREALLLLERSKNAGETICSILEKAKMILGLDAVAIRLRDGDDIPYYATNGFPDEFVHAERFLCARNEAGKMVRDENGKPVLECICGKVLSGWIDPELPFLSESGSFWSNNTSGLLVSTIETECLGRIRGRCIREGYESVALIPLRAGEEIIGLLQFNDRRPNLSNVLIISAAN